MYVRARARMHKENQCELRVASCALVLFSLHRQAQLATRNRHRKSVSESWEIIWTTMCLTLL